MASATSVSRRKTARSGPKTATSHSLAATLRPRPSTSKGTVRKTSLVTRLIDARDRALALVVAPAGYGKSTLIAHWAEWDDRAFLRISLAGCRGNATRQALGSLAEQLEAEAWPTDINASERP